MYFFKCAKESICKVFRGKFVAYSRIIVQYKMSAMSAASDAKGLPTSVRGEARPGRGAEGTGRREVSGQKVQERCAKVRADRSLGLAVRQERGRSLGGLHRNDERRRGWEQQPCHGE